MRLFGRDFEDRGGHEAKAAVDVAFLFFRTWELPLVARLYVSSAAFGGEHVWERGTPLG